MACMKTIDLVYFNAGGGHRAAALALEAVAREQGRPWRVRLVDLFAVLDPQALFRKVAGFAPEDFYNKRLSTGFTIGLAQELKVLQGLIRLAHPALVRQLRQHWLGAGSDGEPDLVVSLVPNFNRALWHSVAGALPAVPFVTVMTDLADHPPHFWIEPGATQHLVCGSARAVQQALAAGLPAAQVHRSSGMILRPDFHRPVLTDRRAERHALGLEGRPPTGVVLFGGEGSNVMRRIAEALPQIPLILLCGRNEALAARLRALPASAPRIVVGYTREVARYMQLGDFLIGKPGPGSLSEAVQSGLPVIVTRNAWTMPQERYNTDWVQELGIGRVLKSFGAVREAVDDVSQRLPELRAAVCRLKNEAVFEVTDLFERLLDTAVLQSAASDCPAPIAGPSWRALPASVQSLHRGA